MHPLYKTVWERGPGQNSVYWQGIGMPGGGIGPGVPRMRGLPPYGGAWGKKGKKQRPTSTPPRQPAPPRNPFPAPNSPVPTSMMVWNGVPQAPIASGPNVSTVSQITVPYRPFFKPTGLQARGMYSGYGACDECNGNKTNKWLMYAALIGAGIVLAKVTSSKGLKINPRKRMKLGERIVRLGAGGVMTVAGAIGWFGPQAAEPITTLVGLPVSVSGVYLMMSGLTSPETAKRIRKEVKG